MGTKLSTLPTPPKMPSTTSDCTAGMKSMRGEVGVAALGVATTVDNAGYLTPSEGSGTHGAGFDGDVEGAVGEVFATEFVGSHGDGLHLGMGGDVVEGLSEVVGSGNDAVLANDDGTNGYFAFVEGLLRLGQSLTHVNFVFFCFHAAKLQNIS